MVNKWQKVFGFPYPPELEDGYNRSIMKRMHRLLTLLVVLLLMFVLWLVSICVFYPRWIGPDEYIRGLMRIHLPFAAFTILILGLTIALRRQMFLNPKLHVLLCNTYACGVCLWSSVLSAYAQYSPAVYTAFVFVVLCVSMVAMFKPWVAWIVFLTSCAAYLALYHVFKESARPDDVTMLFSAILAAILAIAISTMLYRYRVRTYYDNYVITGQLEKINKINRQLRQLTYIDTLTDVYNRRFYDEVLCEEMQEQVDGRILCAIMLDVDHFKKYNDMYGHPMGDICLRRVATVLKDMLPKETAYPVRYGGEEFFVLLKASGRDEAIATAQAICRQVEQEYIIHAQSPFGKVTVSGGVAFCEKALLCDLAAVTKAADEALYRAKENGRNRMVVYEGPTPACA